MSDVVSWGENEDAKHSAAAAHVDYLQLAAVPRGDVELANLRHGSSTDPSPPTKRSSIRSSVGDSADTEGGITGYSWALIFVVASTLFTLTTWFSTNSIATALESEKGISASYIAALTAGVYAGFVVGTAGMSISNLSDLLNPRWLFSTCAILAAILNACVIPAKPFWLLFLLRFSAGICFAGVYPPAMKVLSGWFVQGRGYALGFVVGALTLGSGSPFLLRSLFAENWRAVVWMSSGFSVAGALMMTLLVSDGPHSKPPAAFEPSALLAMVQDLPLALAVVGYLCHQWELYAFWAWVGPFLEDRLAAWDGVEPMVDDDADASSASGGGGESKIKVSSLVAFFAYFVGAVLCPVAGAFADKVGRTLVTSVSLVISGSTALWLGWIEGSTEGGRVGVLLGTLLYGAAIIPDSAQYSACVSELCDPRYYGTLLTASTGLGFLVTIVTIQLVPVVEQEAGWGGAWLMLGIPPLLGAGAMLWLRQLPESSKIAGGNR